MVPTYGIYRAISKKYFDYERLKDVFDRVLAPRLNMFSRQLNISKPENNPEEEWFKHNSQYHRKDMTVIIENICINLYNKLNG